jgi:hypothetical protein
LKENDLPAVTVYIDSNTGEVLKLKAKLLIPSIGAVGVEIYYDDYREQHGLNIPYKTTIKNPMSGVMVVQYHEFKAKQKFDSSVFDISKPKD